MGGRMQRAKWPATSLVLACLSLLLTACASRAPPTNRPAVDLTELGCGYKWFQTGYSEYLNIACERDRTSIREAQTQLARAHAWDVARLRCPTECPPTELADTVEFDDNFPDGVCRGDKVYFLTRVFFACAQQQSSK